jgi:myo-inositol-1(or 4)-monophosphatase
VKTAALPMSPLHPMLQVAMAAARAAGTVIRTAAADPGSLQIRQKHPNDFVTQVDTASEQVIVGMLLGAFPDHAVRSEESQHWHGNANADHVWIVDPLDGTTNFIHGYPAYSVSIALAVRGRVEHGVVLDVTRDHLFHASIGAGAWCNDQRLQVSARTAGVFVDRPGHRLVHHHRRHADELGPAADRLSAVPAPVCAELHAGGHQVNPR